MTTTEEAKKYIKKVLEFAETTDIPESHLTPSLACATLTILGCITEDQCGHRKCFENKVEALKRLIDSYAEIVALGIEEKADSTEHTSH
jgi:hypothetical protein